MQIYAQKIQCCQAREQDEVQTTPPKKNYQAKTQASKYTAACLLVSEQPNRQSAAGSR